ncbi:Uncharacterized protein TPAR_02119 [Tolypocladium paradoxum]|uniref:Phospholipase/carboxylesterase/thioesterase domain-containing protein n=1 Tax=Tolypocladium paradoxum TaxID=94208 RepID=A0A2S4L5I9_9HYPO|nr:Uncharacterized protein TPAR_02119 [Tolypocladium paradoxum]
MAPRIPTEADFAPLAATLPHALHFPNPRESTTAILILLHGLGDSEAPFARFARNMALPGVLAIAVRGTAPLPPSLLLDDDAAADGRGAAHFHWGDDVSLDRRTGNVDPDPGFARARRLVMDALVGDVLVGRCGWDLSDVMLFGFGQGGSLALGLASALRTTSAVVDVTSRDDHRHQDRRPEAFKGAVSIGGPLPASMVPTRTARDKSDTSVLVCQLDEDRVAAVRGEFRDVRAVRWRRSDVVMPRDMEEMFPIMKFFADRLDLERMVG